MHAERSRTSAELLDLPDDDLLVAVAAGDPADLTALAEHLRANGRLEAAVGCLEAALRRDPASWDAVCALVMTLLDQNRADAARVLLGAIDAAHPGRPDRLYLSLQAFPVVYRTALEIAHYREEYRRDLTRLEAGVSDMSIDAQASLLRAICEVGHFFVAYQGYDEREEQSRFGAVVDRLTARLFPPFRDARPAERRRTRVGYISSHFQRHTVCKLVRGYIEHHDADRTEVFAYQLGDHHDGTTEAVARACDRFTHLPFSPSDIVNAVRADALDVLVFTDVGMLGLAGVLLSARLAPVQCVFWGHPITTGLRAADWFISSELMEPARAESHYSERLFQVPGMPVAYARPAAFPPIDRRQLGIAPTDVLYLCCQSLFKYLPQFDDLYARIAAGVPEARFVFLAHRTRPPTDAFLDRLGKAFAARGVPLEERVCVLPALTEQSYLALNAAADVFLDSPGWSGGNTCLEALSTNLPVVTLPKSTMRSRHSAAFLTVLGMADLIARDEDDYVRIAVRLGLEPAYRRERRTFIREHADGALFGQTACVRALEDAFVAWAAASRAAAP